MFQSPLQTTACARYKLDKTTAGIKYAELNEELIQDEYNVGTLAGIVTMVPPGITDFPPFGQPILKVDFPAMDSKVVIDARNLLRVADKTPLKLDVYKEAIRYATLSYLWSNDISPDARGFRGRMLNLSDFPCRVFSSWTSTEISRRLGLDVSQTSLLRVIMAIYFVQSFSSTLEFNKTDEAEMSRIVTRASRNVPGTLPGVVMTRLGGKIPYLGSLQDTVDYIKEVIQSPRVEQLNVAFLYTAMTYSMFPAQRETGAVALEYPPAFISLLYTALTERNANKTTLGMAAISQRSKNNDEHFIKGVELIMSGRG